MALETIGMEVHGVVALVAELRLVLMALTAAPQSDFISNSLAHGFVAKFSQEDPVILAHPGRIPDAALG